MTDDDAQARPTRRELLRRGAALGAATATAAVATAAIASPLLAPGTALAAPVGDVAVLGFGLRAEQVIVYAYERALASGVISAAATPVLTQFLGHEREHVDALTVNLVRLGGAVPAPPGDLATFEVTLRELSIKRSPAMVHTELDHISLLVRIEGVLATAYHFIIDELVDDKLIQTAAQIMATEGQHETVMRELMNPGNVALSVPRAFVGGAK